MGESRRWEDLDIDCLAEVFGKVELKQLLLDVPLVCKSWHKASSTPTCWKNLHFPFILDISLVHSDKIVPISVSKLTKLVVDRSSGSALELVLPCAYTSQDLDYVAEKCPKLKKLTLPIIITSPEERARISKILGKFKALQNLNIDMGYDLEEVVTEIGKNCNNFETLGIICGLVGKEVASAIVTFLPNIKYLFLTGTVLPRNSLMYILKGCRNLVLLDVQNCGGFDEDDQEILQQASHIKVFLPQGSKRSFGSDSEYDSDNSEE